MSLLLQTTTYNGSCCSIELWSSSLCKAQFSLKNIKVKFLVTYFDFAKRPWKSRGLVAFMIKVAPESFLGAVVFWLNMHSRFFDMTTIVYCSTMYVFILHCTNNRQQTVFDSSCASHNLILSFFVWIVQYTSVDHGTLLCITVHLEHIRRALVFGQYTIVTFIYYSLLYH